MPDGHAVAVTALGVPITIRLGGDRAAEVAERVPVLWECCPGDPAEDPAGTVQVVFDSSATVVAAADADGVVAREHLQDLLQVLTQRVTLTAIDARAGDAVMLHAACLANPHTGLAAAFVAPGGTGKTTLVRTLGQDRWYVTDETTLVLDDGGIVPYPKPLSIRRAPESLYKNETAPSAVGLVAAQGPVRLGALCLLDRDDTHTGAPEVTSLDTLDALVALVPQTSHLPEMARPLQRLAALCESLGGVHRVSYREVADLADLVDEWIGSSQ
jgi:hypothetical protein